MRHEPTAKLDPGSLEFKLWSSIEKRPATSPSTLKRLIGKGADIEASLGPCGSSLFWAISCGNMAAVEALLAAGADPNAINAKGLSPMAFCLSERHPQNFAIKCCVALAEAGSDIDSGGPNGEPPLVTCARARFKELSAKLLELGADPDVQCKGSGSTALMWAAYFGESDCVEKLLKAGADPRIQSSDGRRCHEWISGEGTPRGQAMAAAMEAAMEAAMLELDIGSEEASTRPSIRL